MNETEDNAPAVLARPVTCDHLVLRTVVIPQKESFLSAIGRRSERRALIIEWVGIDGSRGFGECSSRIDPFFNGEYLAGAIDVVTSHLAPRLPAEATVGAYLERVDGLRGWAFTRGAITDAMFDAVRRNGGSDLVDAFSGDRLDAVPAGISLGLFNAPGEAVERVAEAIARGYRRIKLKVKPGMDPAIPRAVRASFPETPLLFDANGSGRLRDLDLFSALAELRPTAIEQPCAPGRWDVLRELRRRLPELRVCLDEDAVTASTTDAALELGLADEINLKPGRMGGQLESLMMLDAARRRGTPVWVGGMFETAIGRYQNLRLAALLTDATAHDLSPSDRYFDRDLSTAPPTMSADGLVRPRPGPVEIDEEALDDFEVDRVIARPGVKA